MNQTSPGPPSENVNQLRGGAWNFRYRFALIIQTLRNPLSSSVVESLEHRSIIDRFQIDWASGDDRSAGRRNDRGEVGHGGRGNIPRIDRGRSPQDGRIPRTRKSTIHRVSSFCGTAISPTLLHRRFRTTEPMKFAAGFYVAQFILRAELGKSTIGFALSATHYRRIEYATRIWEVAWTHRSEND